MSISSSCFVGNQKYGPGSVFVEKDSSVIFNDNNFGLDSFESDDCSDIFVEDGRNCLEFSSRSCAAAEYTLSPSPPTRTPTGTPTAQASTLYSPTCFSDWQGLVSAVRKSNHNGIGETFIICSNTILEADAHLDDGPIDIRINDTIIQCGADGFVEDNCVVSGGQTVIKIAGSPQRVMISGLTLRGSNVTSVIAAGDSNAVATFTNCTWTVRLLTATNCCCIKIHSS